MIANREILDMFVSVDPYRNNLTTPWTIGDYTYATCWRTAVRVPGIIEMDETEHAKSRPNITEHVFGRLNTNGGIWMPVASIENPIVKVKCDACNGTGNGYLTCADCDGEGVTECFECGHERGCETCGGTGENRAPGKLCEVCSGNKEIDGYAKEVTTPCAIVQGELLARFQKLADCEMHVPSGFDPLAMIAMRFSGGVGVLMPWRADSFESARAMHAAIIGSAA